MTEQLSNISSEATELTNVTDQLTPILEWVPDNGLAWVIENAVERGDQTLGIPIFAELRSGANTDLPQDTTIALGFEGPNDDQPRVVSQKKTNIRPYNSLAIKDQQNEEYIDRVKHVLKGNALVVEDVDSFYVLVDASAQISWSDSRLTIDENAVSEVND